MIVAAFIGGALFGYLVAATRAKAAQMKLMDEIVRLNTEDDYPGKPYAYPRTLP